MYVPVPCGPGIPRRDREQSKIRHARLMLILFKPWRNVEDLRNTNMSWLDSYESFYSTCSQQVWHCIDNMQILHECKDSRDD
ncbi:hypothetical protein BDQ17DRAFT_1249157, partial [Cyathus striatus]